MNMKFITLEHWKTNYYLLIIFMDAMDSSFYISCFLVKMATIDCQVSQWNWRIAAKKNGRQTFLLEWKSTCTDDFKIKNENPAHFLILYSRYTRRFYDWTISLSLSSPFHSVIPPFSFSLIYCWCCVFLFRSRSLLHLFFLWFWSRLVYPCVHAIRNHFSW